MLRAVIYARFSSDMQREDPLMRRYVPAKAIAKVKAI